MRGMSDEVQPHAIRTGCPGGVMAWGLICGSYEALSAGVVAKAQSLRALRVRRDVQSV